MIQAASCVVYQLWLFAPQDPQVNAHDDTALSRMRKYRIQHNILIVRLLDMKYRCTVTTRLVNATITL